MAFIYEIGTGTAWVYQINAEHGSDGNQNLYAEIHIRNLNQQDHPEAEGLIDDIVTLIEALPNQTVTGVGREKPQFETYP